MEVGHKIREKYKQYGTSAKTDASSNKDIDHPSPEHDEDEPHSRAAPTGILKNSTTRESQLSAKPMFDYRNLKKSGKSRSKSAKKRSPSPTITDPRQQIYEAKFEKYIANKKAKEEVIKRREAQ